MEKTKRTPAMRFRGFEVEWDNRKFGKIFSFKTSNSFSREQLNYEAGNFRNIHYGDIHTKFKTLFDIHNEKVPFINTNVILRDNLEDSFVKEGDLIIVDASEDYSAIGKCIEVINVNKEKVLAGLHTIHARPEYNHPFLGFFGYYMQCLNVRQQIMIIAQGIKVLSLAPSRLANIDLNLPTLPEQQKIASFFTAIDRKITLLKQQKSLLEQYKKGIMQKIFSQELRFRDDDGKEFPEWEEKRLGEVCEIIMGQSPSSNSYNLEEIGIPLIQGNADIQNRLSNPRNWTTEKAKECKIGDLILTVRAPVGAVAKSIHNACIGRGVCAIRNNSKSRIEFIYQFLLNYETKWSSIEQGSTFTAVSGIEIKKIDIKIPCLEEQTKIANFLSALDEKINLCQKQIEKTERWKKGLLQQMFV